MFGHKLYLSFKKETIQILNLFSNIFINRFLSKEDNLKYSLKMTTAIQPF